MTSMKRSESERIDPIDEAVERTDNQIVMKSDQWAAEWITRKAQPCEDWTAYQAEVVLHIEADGASFLFGYQDENNHGGIEFAENQKEPGNDQLVNSCLMSVYYIKQGIRHNLDEVAVSLLERKAAPIKLKVNTENKVWHVMVNEQRICSCRAASYEGTVGFRTKEGQKAVFRDLKLTGTNGRVLYSNRFYDPQTTHCTAGSIHASGNGLALEGNMLSICTSPLPVDSPLFRKTFDLTLLPIEARLRIYSIGWYELHINGNRADERVLAPANTPYNHSMLYDTYDVTHLIQERHNVLGVWLGNGYHFNYSRWGWKWNRDKALILQLDLRFEDGSTQSITTDSSWSSAAGPILVNDIYDGESYDARLEQLGWSQPGFIENNDWSSVVSAEPPAGKLKENQQPPVVPFEPLEPTAVFHPRPGVNVYDFGQNISGWARIQVKGRAGSEVRMKYSELIDESGCIDPWTNRNAKASDTYILRGEGEEKYEPRFTYHGFRYVEVSAGSCWISIQAVPVHADVESAGTFECSDEMLNQLYSNIRWSYLNNLASIPTDCCQRDERTPCLMDSAVVEEAGMHHFNMQRYYRKWLEDIEDSMTNPDWSGDKVSLPWHLYQHYNDLEALRRSYPSMNTYIDHLHEKWPEHIVKEGFGDWCPPNDDGWENYFHEVELVNTSVYYKITSITAETASILGIHADYNRYLKLAGDINRAFQDKFHTGDGIYGSASQTAQLMPLAYGMVPVKLRAAAAARLVQAIAEKDGHLHTGIYGTRYLLDVLADYGHIDTAYELLSKKEYPGFGYQIERGATTLWEQWSEKGGMHSHDHAMFGGISVSFYTRLAGIRPNSPGYEKIWIEPFIPSKLNKVSASLRTAYGLITSSWKKDQAGLHIQVEVPEGTTGTLVMPAAVVTAAKLPRIHELNPGKYSFSLPFERNL
ncbi:family 78 glycoside hydrolase catalytic domain [Paenibacillus sp. FSL R7-0652]|uniref:family 78 glycoside hydrolase catalytic domain n=1 Tax=Paenibacillus sp. FSL R7-0652 TaxID=2921687 RepID=UPI003159C22A